MKKDFTAEINKTNELKKNIIDAIKDYMNEHKMKMFKLYFCEDEDLDNDSLKEEDVEEYERLYDEIECDIHNHGFDYVLSCTYYVVPAKVYVNEGKLTVDSVMIGHSGCASWIDDELETFDEDGLMEIFTTDSLNQILLNLQNEKFHRMNELINNN